jgi:hypothetical protein
MHKSKHTNQTTTTKEINVFHYIYEGVFLHVMIVNSDRETQCSNTNKKIDLLIYSNRSFIRYNRISVLRDRKRTP